MTIYLNGEQRDVPENVTLAALLEWLNLPADRVAVERNREIAARSTWSETLIQPGDHLEVVHFVGGG
jgi:thiamine biosynthesis protein ThiS